MKRASSMESVNPLAELLLCSDISKLEPAQLIKYLEEAEELRKFAPNGRWSRDPRSDDAVLFNPARAKRPVDYRNASPAVQTSEKAIQCPLCVGNTTGILDDWPLTEGRTVVNMNLFPMLLPDSSAISGDYTAARGLHLLQWTSTIHHHDWPELTSSDRYLTMERLATVESALYAASGTLKKHDSDGNLSENRTPYWYVSVIKNAGRAVGGSLEHGHQQIALTDCIPGGLMADRRFLELEGIPFSSWLRAETDSSLIVRDYGEVTLSVPPFMARPFNMILTLADPLIGLLGDCAASELQQIADAWAEGISLMKSVLNSRGREPAYNIVMRSNPSGGGLYFEFLPYSQEYGGFERAGLYSCQSDPVEAAGELRERMADIQSLETQL